MKISFGAAVPLHGRLGPNRVDFLREAARTLEESPIDSIWIEDHFRLPANEIEASEGKSMIDEPLEAWTTLASLATMTKRVMLGTEVTPMTLRNPAMLAKVVANVDILSAGRVILGAGAGWNKKEFVMQGVPFEEREARFEKMNEAVEVVKLLWTSDEVNYSGKYFTLRAACVAPKPVSKPHPPIWFGGFSELILRAVAKHGDGWINATNAHPNEVREQIRHLKLLLADAGGRGMDELRICVPLLAMVANDKEVALRRAEEYMDRGKFDKTLRFFADTIDYGLVGTPEHCISRIKEYTSIGVDTILFDVRPASNSFSSLKLLCDEVIPSFA